MNLHLEQQGIVGKIFRGLSAVLLFMPFYDVFHFYAGCTFLPFGLDLPLLKLFRKKIVMMYAGSEVRLVEVERRRNEYAHLLRIDLNHPRYDKWKRIKMRWQGLWIDRIIAARNLRASVLTCIPEHKVVSDVWLNNTLDLSAHEPEFRTSDTPMLVHAPTYLGIKGTEYIEKVIEELREEGYHFTYKRLHDVPYLEAQRVYREEADIIVDQLLVGGFGNVAVEGMYYGKPVCCYLIDEVYDWYPDCPIVNASIDDLKEMLIWLIENPEERIRLGKMGRSFVEEHCDREKINEQLWALYEEVLGL